MLGSLGSVLMCGLKQLPIFGSAVDLLDHILTSHRVAAQGQDLAALQGEVAELRGLLGQVKAALDNLRAAQVSEAGTVASLRLLQELQHLGWLPVLCEGLLRGSRDWDQLQQSPEDYGTVLAPGDAVNPRQFKLVLGGQPPRILQMPLAVLAKLLADRLNPPGEATVFGTGTTVWGIPAPTPLPAPSLPTTPARLGSLHGVNPATWSRLIRKLKGQEVAS